MTKRGEWPTWYNEKPYEDLKEEKEAMERAEKRGSIDGDVRPFHNMRYKQISEKVAMLEADKPNRNPEEMDKLAKMRKRLGGEIADRLHTHTQMDGGFAKPHDELKRQMTRNIKITEEDAVLAKEYGIHLDPGQDVTRTEAEKMWKCAGKELGEETMVEILRRQGKRGSNVKGNKGAFDN